MPSFDVEVKADAVELRNAVDQAHEFLDNSPWMR